MIKKVMDSFMNEHENGFMQHFEKYKEKNLINREDYNRLVNEKKKIIDEFPNIQKYLINRQIVNMTDEEKEKILKVLSIDEDLKKIEYREIFKLGAKEAYIYFEEMEMLNI